MSNIKIKIFQVPKENEDLDSCQDSYKFDLDRKRFAIADGATREFFSGIFAEELVKRFCIDKDDLNKNIFANNEFKEWLKPAQEKWLQRVKEIVDDKKKSNYIIRNKFNLKQVGASTFVGLELNENLFRYNLMIIGDSCLFHIRNNEILKSYIIDDYRKFDNYPDFFFSGYTTLSKEYTLKEIKFISPTIISSNFKKGDYFLLLTDAMAKWLLEQNSKNHFKEIWFKLLTEDKNWYNEFINKYRKDKDSRLEDDDITIFIISTDNSETLIPFSNNEKQLQLPKYYYNIFLIDLTKDDESFFEFNIKEITKNKYKTIKQQNNNTIEKKYKEGIIINNNYEIDIYTWEYYEFSQENFEGSKYDENYKVYIKKKKIKFREDVSKLYKLKLLLGDLKYAISIK